MRWFTATNLLVIHDCSSLNVHPGFSGGVPHNGERVTPHATMRFNGADGLRRGPHLMTFAQHLLDWKTLAACNDEFCSHDREVQWLATAR
jgi:hypothetical protein